MKKNLFELYFSKLKIFHRSIYFLLHCRADVQSMSVSGIHLTKIIFQIFILAFELIAKPNPNSLYIFVTLKKSYLDSDSQTLDWGREWIFVEFM